MPNMNYCKFENTYNDLLECQDDFDNKDLSESEEKYKDRLLKLCKEIVEIYDW